MKKITSYRDTPISFDDMKAEHARDKLFHGVSFDYNCTKLKRNTYHVILMKGEKKNWGHWVVVCCDEKSCLYFDSYGMPADSVVVKRMRELYSAKNIWFSDFDYQTLDSKKCGRYTDLVVELWKKNRKKYSGTELYSLILDTVNGLAEQQE
jgi:hypothetical protein